MQGNRNLTLDIMKSALVLGMIAAHVFQLCYGGENRFVGLFSLYINIITFSSFMFCFGCTSYLAYFRNKRPKTSNRLINNFLRLLICFYISGFAYLFFVSHDCNWIDCLKVLMLWKIPGYSEFLISFAILNILLFCFQSQITLLLKGIDKFTWGGVIVLPLLMTFIPYHWVFIPQIGIFIGTTKFACFPILQYLPFFLVGMYCQSRNCFFDKKLWTLAILATMAVCVYVLIIHYMPNRFPPSLGWILWPSAFTLTYYIISDKLSKLRMHHTIKSAVQIYGSYTLDYLVISNVVIFAIRHFCGKTLSGYLTLAVIVALFALCYSYGFFKLKKLTNSI